MECNIDVGKAGLGLLPKRFQVETSRHSGRRRNHGAALGPDPRIGRLGKSGSGGPCDEFRRGPAALVAMTSLDPVASRLLDRTGVRGARRGYALTARKGHGAGFLIAKSARRRGEIALQTGGSRPDSPSTALFATLPATASGHPGNLG